MTGPIFHGWTPPPKNAHDKKLKMVRAMKRYGGSFAKALAECFLLADDENLQKLEHAFPEQVSQYSRMAKDMPDE